MKERGHSLVELVIALAILASCFFMIVPMMHYALQYARKVEKGSLAALIARSRLNALRAQAQQSGQYQRLSSQPAQNDADHPEFSVRVGVTEAALYSPSAGLEAAYPGQMRSLTKSSKQVQVDVAWTAMGAPGSLTLVSLISEPARRFHRTQPLRVFGTIPAELRRDATIDFTVKAYDEENREIEDLFYSWTVSAISGTGTISQQSRDGRQATFKNVSKRRNQVTPYYTGGKCKVEVHATLGGEARWALSEEILLDD